MGQVDQSESARRAVSEAIDGQMAGFDSNAPAPAPSGRGKGGRKGGSSSGRTSKSKSSISAEEQERKDFEAALASPLGINGALVHI